MNNQIKGVREGNRDELHRLLAKYLALYPTDTLLPKPVSRYSEPSPVKTFGSYPQYDVTTETYQHAYKQPEGCSARGYPLFIFEHFTGYVPHLTPPPINVSAMLKYKRKLILSKHLFDPKTYSFQMVLKHPE